VETKQRNLTVVTVIEAINEAVVEMEANVKIAKAAVVVVAVTTETTNTQKWTKSRQ
jgi:hypothetical protein